MAHKLRTGTAIPEYFRIQNGEFTKRIRQATLAAIPALVLRSSFEGPRTSGTGCFGSAGWRAFGVCEARARALVLPGQTARMGRARRALALREPPRRAAGRVSETGCSGRRDWCAFGVARGRWGRSKPVSIHGCGIPEVFRIRKGKITEQTSSRAGANWHAHPTYGDSRRPRGDARGGSRAAARETQPRETQGGASPRPTPGRSTQGIAGRASDRDPSVGPARMMARVLRPYASVSCVPLSLFPVPSATFTFA